MYLSAVTRIAVLTDFVKKNSFSKSSSSSSVNEALPGEENKALVGIVVDVGVTGGGTEYSIPASSSSFSSSSCFSSSSSSSSSSLLSVKQLYLSINIRLDPGEIPFAEASNNARVRWSVHIFCNRFDASEINTALSSSFIKSAGELFGVLPHSNLDISADGDKISLLFG